MSDVKCPESNSVPKRIFLSYPHRPDEHSQLVEDVARVIEEKGHDPWFDKNKITPGYDWRMSITKGVLDSDWMIIFMSEEALRPGGVCLDEVGIALHQKKGDETLLTVLLEEEAKVNPPISLTRVQWLDAKDFADYYPKDRNDAEAVKKWDNWLDEEVTKLICHIEKKGDITGQISKLRGRLQPSSFVAEIAHSSQGFVGREWVFEQIETWKEHNRERRTFILQGPAGMGKSAIAAQLSQQMRDVIGIHFCKHNDPSTKDAGNLVRTMAFQIASRNPEYRHWLLDEKLQEKQFKGEKLHTQSAPTLFRELILNSPQINSKSKSRQLLVIDGLDEAFDEQGKNKILELIRDEFKKLPQWLGVVVTTRPEQQIVAALPSSSVLEASNSQNIEDVRTYLNTQFDSIDMLANNPGAKSRAVESAMEKSEGVMLYAAELVRAMIEKHLDPLMPEQFPVGLSGIYLSFMQRNFADIDTYERTSLKVLELIAASPLPISDRLIRAMLGLSQRTFNQSIKPLSSLLVEGDRNNATTRSVFHKSFADWLIRPESIHDYQLEGDGATQIGEFLYQQYQSFEGIELNQVTSADFEDIYQLLPLCLPEIKVWNDAENLFKLFLWFRSHIPSLDALRMIRRCYALQDSQFNSNDYFSHISKDTKDFVGRDWLIDEINQWLEESNAGLCLLEGPIGVGKSALCTHLAEINPNVIGLHFFKTGFRSKQAFNVFVFDMAVKLAERYCDYRAWLLAQLADQGRFSAHSLLGMTPDQVMREFISDVNFGHFERTLIILDGLDRTVYGDKTARNEGEPNLAELLAQEFPKKLPVNVRLLVTSRKVSGVSGLFKAKEIVFSPNGARQSADVDAYLRQAIATQDNIDEPFESALGMAKQASGSSILYASALIRALASGEVSFPLHGTPNLKEVEAYYLNAMREMFGDNKWHQPYKGIAPIDVARELIAFNRPVPRAHFMSKFSLQRRDVIKVLGPLFFALLQDKDDSGDPTYVFFHDSFSRWLTSPNQPHAYQI